MPFRATAKGHFDSTEETVLCPICGTSIPVEYRPGETNVAAFEGGKVFAEFSHACPFKTDDVTLWVEIIIAIPTNDKRT